MKPEEVNRAIERFVYGRKFAFDPEEVRKLPSGPLTELAREDQDIFLAVFEDQIELDFKALEHDLKPAVLAEVGYREQTKLPIEPYAEFVVTLEEFWRRASVMGYWVFFDFDNPFFFDMYVSKVRSVALTLSRIRQAPPKDFDAGAVGLLLGHPYEDVLKFVRENVSQVELKPPFR